MPAVRALIVHESNCPATCAMVDAVAAALTARGAAVDTRAVAAAPAALGDPIDLLVVAAPATPPPARPAAAFIPTVGLPAAGGVRDWVERIDLPHGQPTATFDVRSRSEAPGSPARAAARRLRERGATIIGTRSFVAPTRESRIGDDEQARVRDWAAGLVLDAAIHRVG